MTTPARCACPACLARSIVRARSRLHGGQPDVAVAVLDMVLMDLPPPRPCLGCEGPLSRIAQLEQQLIEARGWARAYQAQERARRASGEKCPCFAGARR